MASDYPGAIDPAVPTLRDSVDTVRGNALQHIADMAIAAQELMGASVGDMTSDPGFGGARRFGNLSQAMQSLFRWETGVIDVTWNPTDIATASSTPITTVNLDFSRFTQPPMVLMQTIEANQDYYDGSDPPADQGFRESKLFPVNITRTAFGVAASSKCARVAVGTSGGIAIKGYWIAIDPPFGFAEVDKTEVG